MATMSICRPQQNRNYQILVNQWKSDSYFNDCPVASFYVTSQKICYGISQNGSRLASELKSLQEEADKNDPPYETCR